MIAHEVAHIKNRDTLIMTIAASLSGAFMRLVNLGQLVMLFGFARGDDEEEGEGAAIPLTALLMLIVAPMAATLIQLAISRAHEFESDATAARLKGAPDGLIGALRKLEHSAGLIPSATPPAAANLCIINPLAGAATMLAGLFRTHPPIEKRVDHLARLRHDRLSSAA